MSRSRVLGILSGESAGAGFGVTWVPDQVACDFAGRDRGVEPATALAEVASSLGVDLAFVPATEVWAPACVSYLKVLGIAAAWAVPGPLGTVADTAGWRTTLGEAARAPRRLGGRIDSTLEGMLGLVRAGVEAGADFVVLADDLAADDGPFFSAEFIGTALMPTFTRVAEAARDLGVPALFHSDGDVRGFMSALHEAGFAGVHIACGSGEQIAAHVAAAKASGLAVLGGVTVRDLAVGSARDVAQALLPMANGGGLVVCDDGGVTSADHLRMIGDVYRELQSMMEDR